MNFLVWWNPSTWLGDGFQAIIHFVQGILNSVLYFLAEYINKVIIYMYGVFNVLCSTRLLDSETINTLAQRISLLLGVLMFFMVSFYCVQYVLEPDKLTDKEKGAGNIVKKVLIVIVMLGLSGTAFNILYSVQSTVINSNIISKLLLPYDVDTENFGGVLSANLFLSFYRINPTIDMDNPPDEVKDCEKAREELKSNIINYEDFEIGKNCLGQDVSIGKVEGSGWFGSNIFAEDITVNIIEFNGIFLVLFSLAALYFLFGYCVSVGIRCIQLAFLEIISPVAIIGYLLPSKDNIFDKWKKIYISTYVDVFLRIAIINFAIYLIAVIFSSGSNALEQWEELNWGTTIFIKCIMIVAILSFAQKAPELIKELFPSGSAKLGLGFEGGKKGLMGLGALLGAGSVATMSGISRYNANRNAGKSIGSSFLAAAGGAVTGARHGFASGAKKGNMFKNLSSGFKSQIGRENSYTNMITSGGSTFGKMRSKVKDTFGETAGQRATRQKRDIAHLAKHKKNVNSISADSTAVNAAKTAYENMVQWKGESIEAFNERKAKANKYWRDMRNAFTDASINNNFATVNGEVGYYTQDSNGNNIFNKIDDDDLARASQIRSEIAQAEDYRSSHNVQYYDENSGTMNDVPVINDRGSLSATERYSMETDAYFARNSKYQTAMANDRAAGVDGKIKDK